VLDLFPVNANNSLHGLMDCNIDSTQAFLEVAVFLFGRFNVPFLHQEIGICQLQVLLNGFD
jgi:hypothetical protein